MSVTTAADLLVRAHHLAIVLRDSHEAISLAQWEQFDVTLHRALHEVVGTDAHRVPRRDPQYQALHAAIRTYPAPLRPPADMPLTPAQAAPLMGMTERTVYRWIATGRLTPVQDSESLTVRATDFDRRQDITPADPTDPHPLARLTVTLGVLADQLTMSGTSAPRVLDEPGEAAAMTRHLLAMARLAAGHTITVMPYADADRPIAVAQYCERILDRLGGATVAPASLESLRSVVPDPAPVTLNDRLEAAIHSWSRAAENDLTRVIPDLRGVRLLGNQAIHLYAVTHQVLTLAGPSPAALESPVTTVLANAAEAFRAADPLWADFTTFARPNLEYANASRQLFRVLDEVSASLREPERDGLDVRRAAADLGQAGATVAQLTAATLALPERLARAQLLHMPKGRMTVVDLNRRRRLLTKHATIYEVEHLVQSWARAGIAGRAVAMQVGHSVGQRFDHPIQSLAPIERSL